MSGVSDTVSLLSSREKKLPAEKKDSENALTSDGAKKLLLQASEAFGSYGKKKDHFENIIWNAVLSFCSTPPSSSSSSSSSSPSSSSPSSSFYSPTHEEYQKILDDLSTSNKYLDQKLIIEDACRNLLQRPLTPTGLDYQQAHQCFMFFLWLTEQKILSEIQFLSFFEDFFDFVPWVGLPLAFCLFEENNERIFQSCVNSTQKMSRLKFLGICVQILHRSSRFLERDLGSRAFLVLSRSLPLFDRSGINSRGDTHRATVPLVERKEVKEKKKKKEGEDADMMEEGEIEREEGEEMEEELMAHFHGHFLEVVGHIRNISSLSKPSSFSSFSSSLSIVLASLEANHSPPSSPLPSKGEEERKWEQGKRESGMIPFSSPSISLDIYCQRYFRDLETMSSQIGQFPFRVLFLSQLLLILEHLLYISSEQSSSSSLKSLGPKLTSDQQKSVKEMVSRITKSLKKCFSSFPSSSSSPSSFSPAYLSALDLIKEREKNWIKWKQESCKPFTVDPASTYRKRKKTMEEEGEGEGGEGPNKKFRLGAPCLTNLWNITEDNFECFKEDEFNYVPSFDTLFELIFSEIGDKDLRDSLKAKNDPIYKWKAHRLLSRTKLGYVLQDKRIIDDLDYVQKLVQEKEGEGEEKEKNEENENEKEKEKEKEVKEEEQKNDGPESMEVS